MMAVEELSTSTMEAQSGHPGPHIGELISVAHKDTIRLMEVYVRRSLSLNNGTPSASHSSTGQKWVTVPQRRLRRHSSDPAVHLGQRSPNGLIGPFVGVEDFQECDEKTEKTGKQENKKKSKKKKKPSLWKSFLGLFGRRASEESDVEPENLAAAPDLLASEEAPEVAVAGSSPPGTPRSVQRRKSKKRKRRRLSIRSRKPSKADINKAGVESIVSVEPSYSYYERVSEEMQKIVHEVKEKEKVLSDDEVIERIIALTKEQGDAIDMKLRENPALSGFFQQMTYSSFKALADAYLETETSPIVNKQLTVLPTAPELVKLAFTLDFTARIASLSRHNIGHITGLGNRYLRDRFEYKQACTDHPWPETAVESD